MKNVQVSSLKPEVTYTQRHTETNLPLIHAQVQLERVWGFMSKHEAGENVKF